MSRAKMLCSDSESDDDIKMSEEFSVDFETTLKCAKDDQKCRKKMKKEPINKRPRRPVTSKTGQGFFSIFFTICLFSSMLL